MPWFTRDAGFTEFTTTQITKQVNPFEGSLNTVSLDHKTVLLARERSDQ